MLRRTDEEKPTCGWVWHDSECVARLKADFDRKTRTRAQEIAYYMCSVAVWKWMAVPKSVLRREREPALEK
jgi:hypothetical protein